MLPKTLLLNLTQRLKPLNSKSKKLNIISSSILSRKPFSKKPCRRPLMKELKLTWLIKILDTKHKRLREMTLRQNMTVSSQRMTMNRLLLKKEKDLL